LRKKIKSNYFLVKKSQKQLQISIEGAHEHFHENHDSKKFQKKLKVVNFFSLKFRPLRLPLTLTLPLLLNNRGRCWAIFYEKSWFFRKTYFSPNFSFPQDPSSSKIFKSSSKKNFKKVACVPKPLNFLEKNGMCRIAPVAAPGVWWRNKSSKRKKSIQLNQLAFWYN